MHVEISRLVIYNSAAKEDSTPPGVEMIISISGHFPSFQRNVSAYDNHQRTTP